MKNVLILEDNEELAQYYAKLLRGAGFKTKHASNSKEFSRIYDEFQPSVILLDIKLSNSELNGLEIFERLVKKGSMKAKVIVISGEASRSEIAHAMKLGAHTFIEKTGDFNVDKFLSDVRAAYQLREQEEITELLLQEKKNLTRTFLDQYIFLGESAKIKEIKKQIKRFAAADVDVMILGDTGTGKEVVAHHLYWQSARAGKPFVKVNAGGLPSDIVDSELFGHKKGSFTDAIYDKKGYFEQANGGCLFLDEISNVTIPIQAKILRAIENKEIRVVGGEQKKVDVRIIFASNKKFDKMIEEGNFRKDLFYRIAKNIIQLPPLVEREDDIILLMNYFCTKHCDHYEKLSNTNLSKIKDALISYQWPGNVRELASFCESLFIKHNFVDNEVILKELEKKKDSGLGKESSIDPVLFQKDTLMNAVHKFENEYILHHLKKNDNNMSKTAKDLGVERSTLYRKLEK